MITRLIPKATAAMVVLLCACGLASAQATRTWVSGVGDDANPCSRTAPCKTFAGAISKTAPGGEIDVLDPGGFGAVTITKSISIEACCIAGVLVSGTNAIVISAPSTSVVVLRGLTFEGLGTGLDAVKFITGAALYVEDSFINNFTTNGIEFSANQATNSMLSVKNTVIRNCSGGGVASGILVNPTGGGAVTAMINNVHLENNAAGLKATGSANCSVSNSVAEHNQFGGFTAASGGAVLNLDHVQSVHNGTGIICNTGTTVRLGNSHVADNTTAVGGTGTCSTYKNNDIDAVVSMTALPQGQQ